MSSLEQPAIDEPRDVDAQLPGVAPAHAWLKPVRVTLKAIKGREGVPVDIPPYLPESELEFVVYIDGFAPTSVQPIKSRKEILEDFLRLASATDAEIHSFASKFGPLLIFPRTDSGAETPGKVDQKIFIETCAVWRYFASCMGALLRIAASFRSGRTANPQDWETIGNFPSIQVPRDPEVGSPEYYWIRELRRIREVNHQNRTVWARLMNTLLLFGQARPWIIYQESGALPRMVFSGPSLLSYLALQLYLEASRYDAFAVCSYCNREYQRLRRAPKTGQRNFCPDCRATGGPVRMGQRLRAQRLRKAVKEKNMGKRSR